MDCYRNAGLRAVGLIGLAALAGCGADGPSGPTTGAIAITSTAQTTADNAAFQYSIDVDNEVPRFIASSTPASYVVPGMTAGAHIVTIRGLAAGCSAGTETRTVTVVAGDTVPVAVDVVCSRTTGDITVTSATTGVELDTDGYTIAVDGATRGTLGPNGTGTVSSLAPGSHVVGLTGLATNCTTTTPTRTVIMTAGAVATAPFAVVCAPRTGDIRFTITTTGDEPDPNGYALFFDNNPNALRPPTTNGVVTVRGVPVGQHVVRIGDIASNCALTTPGVWALTVDEVTPAQVAVTVVCLASGGGTVGFTATDPANDTLPNQALAAASAIDLLSITGRYAPGWLTLTLRFSAPVAPIARLAPNSLYGFLQLDLDENVATGQAPAINLLGGNAAHGVDVTIALEDDSTSAFVVRAGTPLGRAGVRFMTDSIRLSIPLALLSNDDGNFTLSGVFGTGDRPTDLMPDSGVITARRPEAALAGAAQVALPAAPTPTMTLDFPTVGMDVGSPIPVSGWSGGWKPRR